MNIWSALLTLNTNDLIFIITLLIVILYMGFPIRAKYVVGLPAIQISLHDNFNFKMCGVKQLLGV